MLCVQYNCAAFISKRVSYGRMSMHNLRVKVHSNKWCPVTPKMSAHAKKRKVDDECCVFNKTWTANYFFSEIKGKAVRLICGTRVAMLKDYNLNRHYTTKHNDKYWNVSDEERTRKANSETANPTRTFCQTSHRQRCSNQDKFNRFSQNRQEK